MIPHNRPLITEEDRSAVDAALASGWIAQGPQVKALEASFVEYYGCGEACAVASGTAALFLALKALSVGAGGRVAVPTYACSALLNAIHMTGATPLIVDVLADDFCLNSASVLGQATEVDCVIAVHAYGAPAEIATLHRKDCRIIEDCCHSLGGEEEQGPIGKSGDAAVFSFYATKSVTGGQGGMVWARDQRVTEAVRDFREFDCRDSYVPRFNLQMTDIQAALINSQLKRLDGIRARRKAIARSYLGVLAPGLVPQSGLSDAGRMPYRFVVVAPDLVSREALRIHMQQAGVMCNVPIERYELLHRYMKLEPSEFPVAERLADTTLSLPIHSGMTDEQVEQAVTALAGFHP